MTTERSSKLALFPAIALVIFASIAAAVMILLRELLLFTFFSMLLALAMSYPVRWLERWMPRGGAVILVLLVGTGLATGLGVLVLPRLIEQFHSVMLRLPGALDSAQAWVRGLLRQATEAGVPQAGQLTRKFGENAVQDLESALGAIFPAAKGAAVLVATVFLMIVMAAFLVFQPDVYRDGVRALVPKNKMAAFDEYFERLSHSLKHWLGGILIAMTLMGGLTAAGLWIAGIDNWPLLGLLTFLATFVPYLGGIASAIPGLLLALSQSPRHFLYALIVYLGVHFCEGYVVEPFVMRRMVSLPPALLLLGETALGILFGLPGIIVAAPLLVVLQISVRYFYEERCLGKTTRLRRAA